MARILIIDDEADFRSLARRLFERAGFEVDDAVDGEDGIRRLQKMPADLVITDIFMPRKEGLETIMELRRVWPGIKIVAISGGGGGSPELYLELARGLGADAVLPKPVSNSELLETVNCTLHSGTTGDPDTAIQSGAGS